MAYKVPMKSRGGRPPSANSSDRFPIRLTPELRKGMAKHFRIDWSAVCRHAIERVLTMQEGK